MSEKRILITECSGECRNLREFGEECDFDSSGTYCAADTRVGWERIDPKQCENCKDKYFTGETRETVIDKIQYKFITLYLQAMENKTPLHTRRVAEAVLDAILEKR